jgi:hypothetical protein
MQPPTLLFLILHLIGLQSQDAGRRDCGHRR